MEREAERSFLRATLCKNFPYCDPRPATQLNLALPHIYCQQSPNFTADKALYNLFRPRYQNFAQIIKGISQQLCTTDGVHVRIRFPETQR